VEHIEDYYEILQISPNAEPETIHRVYRLLAQRFHPDNSESGNENRFRMIVEAYRILSDAQERAKYDVAHAALKQERWRLVSSNARAEDDFESEQLLRLALLEMLYTRKRTELENSGISLFELEGLTGRPREHLEFTIWYLVQKKLVTRSDGSVLVITADGVEFLEREFQESPHRRRLSAGAAHRSV
jgi:curved DNA-binding protein CbpA